MATDMKIKEFFALPVGTRIRWVQGQMNGKVADCVNDEVHIVWDDGPENRIRQNDCDLIEFVGSLEVIDHRPTRRRS